METFPLELQHIIFKYSGDLQFHGKLELVCRQFKQSVYKTKQFTKLIFYNHQFASRRGVMLRFLASKADLLLSLRKLLLGANDYQQPDTVRYIITASPFISTLRISTTKIPGFIPALTHLPLRKLSIVFSRDLYSQVTEEAIVSLKPTLRHLELIELEAFATAPPPPDCLHHIAKHLGDTLKSLSVCTDDWSMLKHSMKALTSLAISGRKLSSSFERWPASSVDKLLELNPPSVGLNLALCHLPDKSYNTILSHAIESRNSKFVAQLVNMGFDFFLPIPTQSFTEVKPTYFSLLFQNSECVVDVLKDCNIGYWQRNKKTKRGRSIFNLIFTERGNSHVWESNASWIFTNKWPEALKHHTAAELLDYNGRGVIHQMVATLAANRYKDRLTFIENHPELFGDAFARKTPSGQSILHVAPLPSDIQVLWAYKHKIPWNEPDYYGYTALEQLARTTYERQATQLIELFTDEEFKQYVTPAVFPAYECSHPTTWKRKESDSSKSVHKLISLFPRERWAEYITHWVQTALRLQNQHIFNALIVYDGLESETIRSLAKRALLAPWDVQHWASFYRLQEPNYFSKPIPHLLTLKYDPEFAGRVILVLREMLSQDEVVAWFQTVDDKGMTCKEWSESQNRTDAFSRLLGL